MEDGLQDREGTWSRQMGPGGHAAFDHASKPLATLVFPMV